MMSLEEQYKMITRGADEVISPAELKEKLALDRPLVVKAGFDPSAPDIHIGHTVLLRKMRHFEQLGHSVFFLIGDFTGRIGDPSGRSKLRKQLSAEEVYENSKTYKKQIFKILDPEKTCVVFNSKWCSDLGAEGTFDLASRYTVARMLERDDFSRRFSENAPISILEFLYPLFQGYDSVVMESDIELGGTDQKFNLLVGRGLQRNYGSVIDLPGYLEEGIKGFRKKHGCKNKSGGINFSPQTILTMPILEGLDGAEKMSKSLNNYVGISEPPEEMFGKIMSISDELMWRYYELLTDLDTVGLKNDVLEGKLHPKEAKSRLAGVIVSEYHGQENADKARFSFEKIFAKKEDPEKMPMINITERKVNIVRLIREAGFAKSSSEAGRLVKQGAVTLDGVRISDTSEAIELGKDPVVMKVGKRKFCKVRISEESGKK